MDLEELQNKIDHARSLSHSHLPDIPVADFPELINAYKNSKAPYLTFIDEHDDKIAFTYQEFCKKVCEVARFLQNHGLSHGDRIATISHNHWQTVMQYYAAWLLGLVVVPINLKESDDRIAYILENGNVELAFVRADYRKRIRNILSENEALKNIEGVLCEDTIENYSIAEGDLQLEDESLAESDALMVFTSGTTGAPKGVVLSQRNLLEDARSIKQWHKIDEQSRMMCVLPIHHVNGLVVTLLTPFFAGGSTVLNQKFRVDRFFEIIAEEEVHIVSMLPTLLQFLNRHYEEDERPATPSLQHLICGDEPLTIKVMETFEERMNVRVIHGYGLSETTCYSSFVPLDVEGEEHKKWRSQYGYPSIGVDLPANEMAIHDEDGNALDENERGEIVIRGVNVMLGYHNDREANEKAFKHGWFRSGDEGFFIRDDIGRKFFFITGRLKGLIIRGGVNI